MFIKLLKILFPLLLMIHSSNAQLCQGSLGDPIINISFGNGANPGPPLSAATTTYQYVGNDCPSDGYYTVRSNTSGCFSGSWHSLLTDHTGNAGGYFMLVNASLQPSPFYIDTVRGLCGNTTYEFASWVINVLLTASCNGSGVQPNLTFSIEQTDGTVLQSYNPGNIPTTAVATWKHYGFFFTTPSTVSDVVVRIVNNAPGGCGNDLALDDITFRPCGPSITNTIDGIPGTKRSYCEGPQKDFLLSCNVSGGFTNPEYRWQSSTPLNGNVWTDFISPISSTNTVYWVFAAGLPAGIYKMRLAVAEAGNINSFQCRIYSESFIVTVNPNPVTSATNNGPACETGTAILTATGGVQYSWSGPGVFSGSGSPLSLVNITEAWEGKYYVVVKSDSGCIHTDSTMVIVNPKPTAATSFTNTSICFKDSIQLSASGGSVYQWIPAMGLSNANLADPKASPGATTVYDVIVSNSYSCSDTTSVTLNIIMPPVANAGPDKAMLEGESIQLSGTVNGQANTITWSPQDHIDDVHSLTPTVNPPADAIYIMNVVSDFGCGSSTDTVMVKVYKNIYVPNAFTPNGDSKNNTWNIPALAAYPFFEVAVYDRYGQRVFYTKNTLRPWDGSFRGKPLPVGAYTYFINVGTSQYIFKGTVLIIR